MYHETVCNSVFPGTKKSSDGISKRVCVCDLSLAECGFHGFWVWPFGGRFCGNFPLQFRPCRIRGFQKLLFPLWPFRWPLCEFLTKMVTNLVGRRAHSSGPCPRVRLSRFAPAAEKNKKTEKTGSMIFVQNPLFFVQNPHAPSPKNFQTPKFSFKTPKFSFKT